MISRPARTASVNRCNENSMGRSVPAGGPYRVLYSVDDETEQVRVLRVAHRSEAYRP